MGVTAHLVLLRVVEEVGPVGVCLHEVELKELPQAQNQDVVADLGGEGQLVTMAPEAWYPTLHLIFHPIFCPGAVWSSRVPAGEGTAAACSPPASTSAAVPGGPWTHLVADLLAKVLCLVQWEAGYQLGGEHVGAAQLVHNRGHAEEGVLLQQLPGRGRRSDQARRLPQDRGSEPKGHPEPPASP